jgi:Ca-activated chloride channel family protein
LIFPLDTTTEVQTDLSFIAPERLWMLAIVPVLIVLYVILVLRKKRTGMRFTNTALLGQVAPKQSQWRRHLAVAFSLASLVTLVVAWARPNGIEYVPRERATVVLVIDISQSMTAVDVEPTRLDAAKTAALAFVRELPAQYNVAIVSLSGNPAVRMPPSTDRVMAERTINALEPQDSTAIGEALYTSITALELGPRSDDGSLPPGAIVLLSDGQNTAGRSPLQAAGEVAELKVPVYTISYGTENGYVDIDDKRELATPDPELMKQIAADTGGDFHTAETATQLERVYSGIGSEIGQMPAEKEVTATWAGYGLAFAVLAALAAVSLGVKWP